jgi:DNA invertase Pin-like site-specific DNA recombinase
METTHGRPAIYARFSSSRQDERSIDDQVRRCRAHLGIESAEAEVLVFADYAVSGASLIRPGFEALMAAVNAGTVGSIVTEDISRISRDLADAAQIFKRLQYARVPLISVADGIDTSTKHAKLTYAIKSLVADLYLDDLRDKTLRGMEGRALAGFATGQVPYGYRTRSQTDGRGRELGREIYIVENAARIVVRIFTQYAEGRSMTWIARKLNREGVRSPRMGTRHQFAGWSVGTIRVLVRNERYIGTWRFKTMQWVKVPGTNRRLPRKRPASDNIVRDRPDLLIVNLPLWEAVQARIAKPRPGRGLRRTKSRYLLSGLIVCAECAHPMTICGGMSSTYYRCVNRTKGICTNTYSIRAVELLAEVFGAIRERLRGHPVLRAAIETHNGQLGYTVATSIALAQKALTATEEQIARLVAFVADGGQRLDYVAERIRRLEITARTQKAEIEVLRCVARRPLRKVSPREIGTTIMRLRSANPEEVEGARDRLRRWTGKAPIQFDGMQVVIEIVPAALVADVAGDGAPAPIDVPGDKVVIRVPVAHLTPQPKVSIDTMASWNVAT